MRRVEPGGFTRISALGVEEQRVSVILDASERVPGVGDGFRAEVTITLFAAPVATLDPLVLCNRPMAGDRDKNEEFFPRGAIAFFAAMTAFFGAVWLALYALMLYRH